MQTADFHYQLPEELIAQTPLDDRQQARMMVVHRATGDITHARVRDLPAYLQPGDLLVLNDTKVIPARLLGRKADSGGRVELLLVEEVGPDVWDALWRATRPPRPGTVMLMAGGHIQAVVVQPPDHGRLRVRLSYAGNLPDILEAHGRTPLPPYIRRTTDSPGDRQRYQTVYARNPGAVAAPTAGLHFTPALLQDLESRGIPQVAVTLHVGPGTFRPVNTANIEDHRMDAERYVVPEATARAIQAARRNNGRIVAVGSTVVRTLESVAAAHAGKIVAEDGRSTLFIRPPFIFRATDVMLTNFHLPASTLLMMVSALAGMDLIRKAYALAVEERYRFFSYGDCMLILP